MWRKEVPAPTIGNDAPLGTAVLPVVLHPNGCIRVPPVGAFGSDRASIHDLSRSECRANRRTIKSESVIQGKMTKKSNFYLSLGFLGISGPSLEKVTPPRQKVLNMG